MTGMSDQTYGTQPHPNSGSVWAFRVLVGFAWAAFALVAAAAVMPSSWSTHDQVERAVPSSVRSRLATVMLRRDRRRLAVGEAGGVLAAIDPGRATGTIRVC